MLWDTIVNSALLLNRQTELRRSVGVKRMMLSFCLSMTWFTRSTGGKNGSALFRMNHYSPHSNSLLGREPGEAERKRKREIEKDKRGRSELLNERLPASGVHKSYSSLTKRANRHHRETHARAHTLTQEKKNINWQAVEKQCCENYCTSHSWESTEQTTFHRDWKYFGTCDYGHNPYLLYMCV